MWKKLIALFFGANALALGGDATIDNIPKIEAKDIPVAEEVVKIKEVDNVVEAEFSWKDATPIKVKYDLGEPTLAEKIKDKRDASVITETVAAFDGGFKIDILLEKIPASNVFCYAIEGHENYDFFFQPPLTPEEIANGDYRPPEIEGSYAVYHKTLKNHQLGRENYATGKVMHIPRPQVWSTLDVNTKVWADMTYDNGQLCVTVPQDFLAKAKYPVRVDPTFGYTSVAGSVSLFGLNYAGVNQQSISEDGEVTKLSVYADSNSGGSARTLKGAIYNNGSSDPGTKNSITSARTDIDAVGWYDFTFSANPNLTTGDYWLGVFSNINYARVYYDTGGSNNMRYDLSVSYASPPASWETSGDYVYSRFYSIYATYTASGGGGGGGESTVVQDIFWFD